MQGNIKRIKDISSLNNKFCEDSTSWLVAALDPFHDYQYSVEGLPDERTAPSVCQIHNQVLTITAPTTAAGGQWDCSVLFTGFNSSIDFHTLHPLEGGMETMTYSNIHHLDHQTLSAGLPFGALNVWAGAAGSHIHVGAPGTVGDTNLALGSVMGSDRCRLVASGFEITNTTAEVYKQGSLTAAMLPDTACDAGLCTYFDSNVGAPFAPTPVQADRALVMATELGPLMAVPGSQTWAAADGVYAIPRMTTVPRDIATYTFGQGMSGTVGATTRIPIIYGSSGDRATPSPTGWNGAVGYQFIFAPRAPNGFSPMQVFCSGLSPETSLTLKFRTVVEYFPSVTSILLPLASPSPVYDPKVLAAYSYVVARAAYAEPVGQNAAGEYFRKILMLLSMGLDAINPVFGSYAPIAMAASSLAKAVSSRIQVTGEGNKIRPKEAGPANGQLTVRQMAPALRKKINTFKKR